MTPCLDLSALVTCHTLYVQFTCWQSAVFLLNSRMGPFSAPPGIALEDPFFRSYGVCLPSSLTVNHPSALVYSTRPRVSVYGTGNVALKLSGVSRQSDYRRYRRVPGDLAYCRRSARDTDFPISLHA